jgi:transcriptional regulator with XRE-family HTH domain
MAETMGQIIRRLRKELNLTQEELAEQLNISAPAVSKWENDTAMPDISQVVPLANLFGVPTDVLFGVCGNNHEEEIKRQLDEIFRIEENCKDDDKLTTAIKILDKYRELMRLYPNNPMILHNASAFAVMVINDSKKELCEVIGQDGIDSLIQEVIRWSGMVIKYSTSIDHILAAKSRLIDLDIHRKNWDSACKTADSFPAFISNIKSIKMAEIKRLMGETNDERELRRLNIMQLTRHLADQVFMLGDIYMRKEEYKDALYCYSVIRNVLNSMFREEEYRPPFIFRAGPLYRYPVYCLMKLGHDDEAIALLEEGVEFFKVQSKYMDIKTQLDNTLLRDKTICYSFGIYPKYTLKDRLINLVCCDELKPLTENPRYQKLVESISK